MEDKVAETYNEPMNGTDKKISLLQLAYMAANVCSWDWDAATGRLTWLNNNGELEERVTRPGNVIYHQEIFGNILPEHVEQVQAYWRQLPGKPEVSFEFKTRKNNGDVVTMWAHITAETDGGMALQCIRGMVQHVTGQMQYENNLKLVNEAFQQSEKMANVGNWQCNLSTSSSDYSGNLFGILGVQEGGLKDGPSGFKKYIHPDDVEKFDVSQNLCDNPGSSVKSEFRIIRPDGQVRHVKSVNKCFRNLNNETIILGTLQDITSEVQLRKHLEEKASLNELIIENNVDYVAAYNTKLQVTAWNRRCEDKTGLKKEQVIGKHVLDVFTGTEGKELLRDLETALNGKVVHRPEKMSDNGFFDFFISPLVSEGAIFGAVCISHDLSEIKSVTDKLVELNESLRLKNAELEQTNNELASFSYVASHDLQEPLRKIQTFSNRIMEKELASLSPQGIEYFSRMEAAAKRMQVLIDDLLTFSRTNTQQKDFSKEDLNALLQNVKAEIKEVIDEKRAVIESDELPVANVISFQFHQLLVNLLLNALKYNKPGVDPHIKISSSIVNSKDQPVENGALRGTFYKIDIADNGIGFEQQYNQKIFELFQRMHGKSEYPGTGLGLAICRRIMQNHEGMIVAEGRPGEGAIFSIYLPV